MYFLLAGVALVPFPGLQNDEVLFGMGVFAPQSLPGYLSILHKPFPLMILPYLGALKSWLYAPILKVLEPTVWTIRIPVLLLAALTLWLFFRLLRRLLGTEAAVIGSALLAADTTFLVTSVFDWGPVVFQRLFAVGGALALVRFHESGLRRHLGIACFLFGLGMWDKALFGWTLAGAGVGVLVVAPGAIRRAWSKKNLAVALMCFLVGVYPLLRYNHRYPFKTIRSSVGWAAPDQQGKLNVMTSSLDGSSLLGYITVDDAADHPRTPRGSFERASIWLDDATGSPRRSLFLYALGLSILLLPVVRRSPERRAGVFALVFLLVSYGLMYFGAGTGGAAHHVSLMWPVPHLLVAAVLTGAAARIPRVGNAVLILLAAVLCVSSALTTNVHLAQFIRNGAAGSWTDAVFPLSQRLKDAAAKEVVVLDWGIFEPLRMLHKGRLPLLWGADVLQRPEIAPDDRRVFREMVEVPGRLFVAHVDSQEQFAGVNARFRELASEAGYERQTVEIVRDSHRRPVFEVFRMVHP